MEQTSRKMHRRSFVRSSLTAGFGGFWADQVLEAYPAGINTNSKPSSLRISDLRIARVAGAPMQCVLVRIDTNQGIYGLGEQRPNSSPTESLRLKSRLLGENPCNVEKIFRKIRQFANNGRNGGGVSAIETALWDLAGKAYGVAVYQMLGGKYRDRIRCYADTSTEKDPKHFAQRLKSRMDEGYTWLKMDLGLPDLDGTPELTPARWMSR
jgi:L-alanine-DL-glutamate epimerase-like enolase superfamily enzyme